MAAPATLSPDIRKALAGHAEAATKAHVHRNRHEIGRAIAAIRLLKQKRPNTVVQARQVRAAIVAGPATRWATQALKPIHRAISVNELIAIGTAAWAAENRLAVAASRSRVAKAGRDDVVTRIAANLRTKAAAIPQAGAMAGYIGLAEAASTEAGQMTLNTLGINNTWRWTGIRDVTPDLFQARGSKIIQGMYGQHVDRLAGIAARATNPAAAQSMGQVRARINEEWAGMERYQVDRIARTETAIMWETTAANTYTLNGIQFKEWLDAGAEDELCLDNVADGVIPMADAFSSGDTEPPAHPNCVCDLLPVLQNEDGSQWLPPAEPFTGNVDGMPLVSAPVPGEGAVGELLSPVGTAPIPVGVDAPFLPPLPEGMETTVETRGVRVTARIVDAEGREAGNLDMVKVKGGDLRVTNYNVDDAWQHKGLATRMVDDIHAQNPDAIIMHDASSMTPEGRAWAESLPREWNRVWDGTNRAVDIRDAEEAFKVVHEPPSFGFNGVAVDDRVEIAARRTYANLERRFPDITSRWDGTFNVGDNAAESVQRGAADAVKEWTCSISMSDNLMRGLANGDPQAEKVLAHELAHSFSVGSGDPVVYAANRGMEEGVVEGWANAHFGGDAVRAVYDEFAAPLEQARAELGMSETEFYDELIRQPLADRGAYLEDLVGHPIDMPYQGARGDVLAEPFPKGEAPWFAGRDAAPRWNNMLKVTKMRASQVPEDFDYGNGVRNAIRFSSNADDFPLGQPAVFNGDHVVVDAVRWNRLSVKARVDLLANNAVGDAVNQEVLHGTGDVKKFVDLMNKFQVPGTGVDGPPEYSFQAALSRETGNVDLMPAAHNADNLSIEDLWRETTRKVLDGTDDMTTQAARDIADQARSTMTRLGFQTNRTARLQRARIEEYLANLKPDVPDVPALGRDAAKKTFQDVVDEAANIRNDGPIGKGINHPDWGMVQGPDGAEVKVVLKNPTFGSSGYGTGVDHERGAKVISDWFDGVTVPESGVEPGTGKLVSKAALNPDGTVAPTARIFETERLPKLSQAERDEYRAIIEPQKDRQRLLDYLIGNHDRHQANYLVQTVLKEDGTETWNIVSIDNEVFAPTGFNGGRPDDLAYLLTQDDAAALQGMVDDPALADWYQPEELRGLKGRTKALLDEYEGRGNPLPPPARMYAPLAGPNDPNWVGPMLNAPVELGDPIGVGMNQAHFAKLDLGGGNFADVVIKPNNHPQVLANELLAPDVNEVGGFGIKMPAMQNRDLAQAIDFTHDPFMGGTAAKQDGLIMARIPDVINGGEFNDLPMAFPGAEGPAFGVDRVPLDIQEIVKAQRRRIDLFDRVIGNVDRNAGNWMVNPDNGDVWAIDHGLAFGPDTDPAWFGYKHSVFPNGEEGWADVNLTNEERDILQRVFDDLNDPAGSIRQLYGDDPSALDAMQARVEKMLERNTINGSVPPPMVAPKPIINPALDPKFDERLATGQLKVGAKVGVDSVNDVKFGRIDGLGKDGFRVVVKTRGGYGDQYFGAEKELGAQVVNDALGEVGANLPRVVVRNVGSGNEQIVVARIEDATGWGDIMDVQPRNYKPLEHVPQEDLRGMQLLDNLVGNTDRHMGNVMFTETDVPGEYRLYAIDHGLTFGKGATEASGDVANAILRAEGDPYVVELTSQERETLRIMLDNWPATEKKLIDAGIDTAPGRFGGLPPIEQVRLRAQAMYDQNRLLGWTQAF